MIKRICCILMVILMFQLPSFSQYFPLCNDIKLDNCIDTFENKLFTKTLKSFNEINLYQNKMKNHIIRFTYLRSFDPDIVIRIDVKSDSTAMLFYKEYNPKSELIGTMKDINGTNHVINPEYIYHKLKLSRIEVKNLNKIIEKNDYWNLLPDNHKTGFDGAEWILEIQDSTRYRFVKRWSPDNDPLKEICLFIIKLSKQRIDRVY